MASATVSNAAEILLHHALSLDWTAIPPAAQQAAKIFLHDSLSVGVAGVKAPHAEALRQAVQGWGSGGCCSVLGCPDLTLPAPSAAFLNAFQIHSQEFDCVHEAAIVHPLATIVATLMAEAERSGPYDGASFLTALVGGVDTAVGLGLAVKTAVKFFRPATAGIFGSVVAVARLRNLPMDTALNALGYALAFASGSMQAHVEGKPALPVQIANAARGAIAAIDMALAGLPGPIYAIDGPFGYLRLFETASDIEPVLAALGTRWRISEVSWKPFPTGRAAQGGIVAIQNLMTDSGLSPANLISLCYEAPPLIKRLVGRPAQSGMTPSYARLCLPWLGALVLTSGTVGLEDFSAERLADPRLIALAEKITVVDDGTQDPAAFTPARAIAVLADGRTIQQEVTAQFGSPAWPLSIEQHLKKSHLCQSFGGLPAIHETVAEEIKRLDSSPDVSPLLRLLAGRSVHCP